LREDQFALCIRTGTYADQQQCLVCADDGYRDAHAGVIAVCDDAGSNSGIAAFIPMLGTWPSASERAAAGFSASRLARRCSKVGAEYRPATPMIMR